MRTLVVTTLAAGALLLIAGEQRACAQAPGVGSQPPYTPYSPYLNLFRPGSLTQNYWGLVQPELQWRGSVQGLQQQANANSQAISNLQQMQGPPSTGHGTRFLSTGGYFLSGGASSRRGR
jgi:hypothetical protein